MILINQYLTSKFSKYSYFLSTNYITMITRLLASYFILKQFGSGKIYKWKTLEHNGVLFPPPYEVSNIPLIYKGNPIILPPLAEEYALLYAKYVDSEYITKRQFKKNFWKDWKPTLKGTIVESLNDCDFINFVKFIEKKKNSLTPEIKEKIKEQRIKEEEPYKTAMVDGKPQPVGNFRMEPPGIFMGRGDHPKLGKIKKRIYPEDIIINIGKGVKIPQALSGHKWGKVIHDRTVEWLASWKDNINGKTKYVWLGNASEFRKKNDLEKFELARTLKKLIPKIKKENTNNLSSLDDKTRQLATSLYFIDKLALRIGNEKGEDEADTVGVTSLRVEHISLLENNKIKLDFLGKDSIRYINEIVIENEVYSNLQNFLKNKSKDDLLFDLINSTQLNKYIQSFMESLTAKVFRTYNASNIFQEELNKITEKYINYNKSDRVNLLLDLYNKANAKVACVCNHQKNVSKNFKDQLKKIDDRIKELKDKKKIYIEKGKDTKSINSNIEKLKRKKIIKKELKNLALGTSKTSYIDPRITVAFLKKHNLPVEKIFSKVLIEKFGWAFEVDDNWQF